jgi:hypothetical protein
VDAGYANSEGFLAPYRGYRYHRSEWRRGYTPSNKQELFNMRHSMARNVIETRENFWFAKNALGYT